MPKRRDFLKFAGFTGVAFAHETFFPTRALANADTSLDKLLKVVANDSMNEAEEDAGLSIIGPYGAWADSLRGNQLPSLSYRRPEFRNVDSWRQTARQRVIDRMGIPPIQSTPKITVNKLHTYDGLHIEEISWQLPYGRPTEAILLKPAMAKGKLPGILALHDHGGNKYFGCHKITKVSDDQHPLMKAHQEHYYTGTAWANEIAKLGYVVLVPDAFAFGSRRVHLDDVPLRQRNGLKEGSPDDQQSIAAYNGWASDHEPIMAKSLFSAGTSWPGVFIAEDRVALDILTARPDVDAQRTGCCGLSGGGLRTAFLSGLDPRIKCAVNVGFTTTWTDFILNKSFIHTWMAYVPMLPNELDFPEIMGLRVPLPTLVLNDSDDQLYTLSEMQKAEAVLTEIFKKAGASDKFRCSYYPGLHKFDRDMQGEAFKWFDHWLKA